MSFIQSDNGVQMEYKPKHMKKSVQEHLLGNQAFILFLLTIPYIEPQLFKYPSLGSCDKAFMAAKLISAVVVGVLYIVQFKRLSKLIIAMGALQLWVGISTIINGGSITRFAGPALTSLVAIALIECALRSDFKTYLYYIRNILIVYYIINILTLIGMQVGVYPFSWAFLGMDNRWIYFYLPWIVVSFLYAAIKKDVNRWVPWIIYCACSISLLATWSIGALLSILLWIPMWIIGSALVDNKRMSLARVVKTAPLWIYGIDIALNWALLSGWLLRLLSPLINLFGKDVTLAGRTFLWSAVVNALAKNPLFGAGVQPELIDKEFFFNNSPNLPWTKVNHPHNMFMNFSYHGGLPAGIGFAAICGWIMYRLYTAVRSRATLVLLCGMSVFLFASLVDTLDFGPLFQVLALAFYAQDINALAVSDEMIIQKENG